MKLQKFLSLLFYYLIARKLPRSSLPIIGPFCRWLRYMCCRSIFKKCGKGVNIERNAYFGIGFDVEIGDHSGIGFNCAVPSNIRIGSHVMMAPDVLIHKHNHAFEDTSVPMISQGIKGADPVVIGDDVWIGQRAIVNPGRIIRTGSIIASGTVLTTDYPEFSIIGGNPSRLLRSRGSRSTKI